MKLPTFRRPYSLAVLFGSLLALTRCDHEPLAGSSVTTGNPTEIQVSFTGENGPTALTGRVEIYGATQIPIPGFRPDPLVSLDVAGLQDVRLDASAFAGIADSLWPAGSLYGDSLARFNLVFNGQGQGAILRDLALRRKAGEFVVDVASTLQNGEMFDDTANRIAGAGGRSVARLEVGLTDLVEYRAYIDPQLMDPLRNNFLFLKGTGFAVQGQDGIFLLSSLPSGEHSVSFLSLPDPAFAPSSEEDTAYVYSLDHAITPGVTDTLAVTGLDFRVSLPDKYKR